MELVKYLRRLPVQQQRQESRVPSVEGQQKGALYINKVSLILLDDGFCFTGTANLVPSTHLGHAAFLLPRNP